MSIPSGHDLNLSQVLAPEGFRFRPRAEEDLLLIRQLYIDSRWPEHELFPAFGDPGAWRSFLEMQFDCQDRDYRARYPDAFFLVLLQDLEITGRLYLQQQGAKLHIIELLLAPGIRNRGVGRAILENLQRYAAYRESVITLYVDRANPAIRLYGSLGFVALQQDCPSLPMHWPAPRPK